MSGGTSIDDLMKNVNEGGNFSDNENSMVDSIINELNGGPIILNIINHKLIMKNASY